MRHRNQVTCGGALTTRAERHSRHFREPVGGTTRIRTTGGRNSADIDQDGCCGVEQAGTYQSAEAEVLKRAGHQAPDPVRSGRGRLTWNCVNPGIAPSPRHHPGQPNHEDAKRTCGPPQAGRRQSGGGQRARAFFSLACGLWATPLVTSWHADIGLHPTGRPVAFAAQRTLPQGLKRSRGRSAGYRHFACFMQRKISSGAGTLKYAFH